MEKLTNKESSETNESPDSKVPEETPAGREFKIEFNSKTLLIAGLTIVFAFILYTGFQAEMKQLEPEKPITAIVKDIRDQKVKSVVVEDEKVKLTYKDDKKAFAYKEANDSFIKTLRDAGIDPEKVPLRVNADRSVENTANFVAALLPTALMIAFFIFIFRQAKGAQDNIFSFGQNRSKRYIHKDKPSVTFADVAGVDEAKKELEEIVDFLRNPEKYQKLGARTPKGVILVGPSGCGKTLLAKAVAGEAGVPFFSIAGSEFMEMLVGIGAARARDLFANAKKSAPAIIFIDEIDAIGRARSSGMAPAHDEREQTLNQILVEMDGFEPNTQVIVIAATNRGDLLDNSLTRPGRFDRRVVVDYPDVEGRKSILEIHSKGKPLAKNVDMERVALRTVGYSGADLENMMNEAAISAARNNRDEISTNDIEDAATKVKLGPEKKRLQTEYDRKLTAYHEAGHAIVTHFMPHTDPVHRISIVSRGMALGYTLIPPAKDKLHETKTHLLERIAVMMGGRAAEEVIFNEITTGAANDFDQATSVARAMVMEYGMSALGPINLGPTQDITEWNKVYYDQSPISESTQTEIDVEIKKILHEAYEKAKKMIGERRDEMDKVSAKLLEKESLDGPEFEEIVGKKEKSKTLKAACGTIEFHVNSSHCR